MLVARRWLPLLLLHLLELLEEGLSPESSYSCSYREE